MIATAADLFLGIRLFSVSGSYCMNRCRHLQGKRQIAGERGTDCNDSGLSGRRSDSSGRGFRDIPT
jgi:hypothetical protein